jgi:hypothetical protein
MPIARDISEKEGSLWWVAAPPGIWAVHFLLSYGTVAVWCAKYAGAESSLLGARWAIAAYTAAALGLMAVVARRGLGQWRSVPPASSGEHAADEIDSPEARQHFLGFTLLALSALSALAVAYEALAAVFIGSCV